MKVRNEVLVPESDCKNFEHFIKSARRTIRSIERLIQSLHHVVKFYEPVGWFISLVKCNGSNGGMGEVEHNNGVTMHLQWLAVDSAVIIQVSQFY